MHQIKTGQQISHQDLREEHIPRPGASWSKIIPFASTFNAYSQLGSLEAAAAVGNRRATALTDYSFTELRSALFFEYRRYNHFGYDPTTEKMIHLHALVEEIRRRVQGGEHLHAGHP
jgi:hypothetical protein